ncbi:hypothetical protein IPN35_00665 [Candidatus Peregrinibacteria bacterium]|nr:MAG: hypothetical protein IPN35_00665 [Candidatus Peregrinibacteria bacterium]
MRTLLVASGVLGVALAVVSLEIVVRPETLDRAEVALLPQEESQYAVSEENKDGETPVVKGVDPKQYFSVAQLESKGASLEMGNRHSALFQHASVQPERDGFLVVTFPFLWNGEKIGQVSRVIPTESMSAGRLFSLVRAKIDGALPKNLNAKVSLSEPQNTVGKANFYLNDTITFPDTVFMVARSDRKVLAFQYQRSYHDALMKSNIFPLFFQ